MAGANETEHIHSAIVRDCTATANYIESSVAQIGRRKELSVHCNSNSSVSVICCSASDHFRYTRENARFSHGNITSSRCIQIAHTRNDSAKLTEMHIVVLVGFMQRGQIVALSHSMQCLGHDIISCITSNCLWHFYLRQMIVSQAIRAAAYRTTQCDGRQ